MFRFGAILVLYQNYQDRLCKDREWNFSACGENKAVESIYGKTIGNNPMVNNQPLAASMIGGASIYSSHQINKNTTPGSVLSHTGSNNNVSTNGKNTLMILNSFKTGLKTCILR